jgi:hypothetical protein
MGKIDPETYFADTQRLQFHPPAGEAQLERGLRRPPQRGPNGVNAGDPESPIGLDATTSLHERPMLEQLASQDESMARRTAIAAFNALGQRLGDLATGHHTVTLYDGDGTELSSPGAAADPQTQGVPTAVQIGTSDRMTADTRWLDLFTTQDLRQADNPYFKIVDVTNAITFEEYQLGEEIDMGFVATSDTIYEAAIHAAGLQWNQLWAGWQDIWQSGDGMAAMQAEYVSYQAKTAYQLLANNPATNVSWQGSSGQAQTVRDIKTINEGIREIKERLFEATGPEGEQREEQLEDATFAVLYDSLQQGLEDRVNGALEVTINVDENNQSEVTEVRANAVPIGTPHISGGPYVVLPERKNVLGLSRDLTMYDVMDAKVAGVAEGSVGQAAWRMVKGEQDQVVEVTFG